MYTEAQLKKYPYFVNELESAGIDQMLDPLTGIVSRAYIIGFAQSLIEEGIPFTFAMLDLDNFKFINDTYGHHAGDGVLMSVGSALADYLDGYGIAGRFGGDELLIINLRDHSYQEKKEFLENFYAAGTVIRKNVPLEDCNPFITGTVGCATFPDDAKDYDELFSLMDKALYRGKTKGRNCYIIYVESKHKNIEIRKIARKGIYTNMHSLIRQFEMVPGVDNKLRSVMPLLMEELQISDLYFVGKKGIVRAVRNTEIREEARDIINLMSDDLYASNSVEPIEELCPVFYSVLKKWEVETVLVVRVGMDNVETDGFLICAEPRSKRIWQEEECALMYFLAKLLAYRIRIGDEMMPEDF